MQLDTALLSHLRTPHPQTHSHHAHTLSFPYTHTALTPIQTRIHFLFPWVPGQPCWEETPVQCLLVLEREGAAAISRTGVRTSRTSRPDAPRRRAFRGHCLAPIVPPAACGAQAPPPTPTPAASPSLSACPRAPAESLELFSQAKGAVTPTLTTGTGRSRTWRPEVAREDVGPTEPGRGPKLLLYLSFASFPLQIPFIMPPG